MNKKILIILVVILLIGLVGYYRLYKKPSRLPASQPASEEISSGISSQAPPPQISSSDKQDYLDQALHDLSQVE